MNQRNPTMKLIASTVVFTFFVTSLGITPYTFAATGVPTPEVSPLTARTLAIPAELGQVTDSVMGDSTAPSFIHIQSAHGNYQAEKNIEKLLGYIEKNSSVKLMLLEGAANKLQPELFRLFPKHPDFNRKVTDKLMQEGYLTGPESFLIDSANKTEGWGIENLDAYKKDREAFISVVKKEKTAEKFLGSLRVTIDRRFSSKLNKDLLNLVRQEEAFGSGTVSFESWIKTLGEGSKRHLKTDLSDAFYQDQYPFLIRYFRLQAIGSKIDREKARREADAFLNELAGHKVSKEILGNFKTILQTSETDLLKTVSRTTDGYSTLRRAFDLAFNMLPKDFSMAQWPNWTLYAQYIILMQEMEGKGLHEETLKLKDKIQTALAKTAEEKEYLAKSRKLYLLRRLFNLELTRPEYDEIVRSKAYGVRSNPTAQDDAVLRIPSAVQKLYDSAMDFYATAVERENKMFANALKRMSLQKQDRAVIVTGGFHADGLKKLAASKNCSYMQITPRIAEVSKRDHEVYLRSILGSRDIETSQMSALLGIVDRAQRVAVTGVAATKGWARDVRELVSGMINSEDVSARPALSASFANSVFGVPIPALTPVVARAKVRQQQPTGNSLQSEKRSEMRVLPWFEGESFLPHLIGALIVSGIFFVLTLWSAFFQLRRVKALRDKTGDYLLYDKTLRTMLERYENVQNPTDDQVLAFAAKNTPQSPALYAGLTAGLASLDFSQLPFGNAHWGVAIFNCVLSAFFVYQTVKLWTSRMMSKKRPVRDEVEDSSKEKEPSSRSEARKTAEMLVELMAKRDALPAEADLLVIFGSPDSEIVAQEAAKVFVAHKIKRIIVAGKYGTHITPFAEDPDQGKNEQTGQVVRAEALIMRDALIRNGVPADAIWVEKESQGMTDNGVFSVNILKDKIAQGFDFRSVIFMHAPLLQLRGSLSLRNALSKAAISAEIYDYAAPIAVDPAKRLKDILWQAGRVTDDIESILGVERLGQIRSLFEKLKSLNDQQSGRSEARLQPASDGQVQLTNATGRANKLSRAEIRGVVTKTLIAGAIVGMLSIAPSIVSANPQTQTSMSREQRIGVVFTHYNDPAAARLLIDLALNDSDYTVRNSAVKALLNIKDASAAPAFTRALSNEDYLVRTSAVEALREFKDASVVRALIKALNDKNNDVRGAAAEALRAIKDPSSVSALIKVLHDKNDHVRYSAVKTLGAIKDASAVPALVETFLHDGDYEVREAAIEALGMIGDSAATSALIKVALYDYNKKSSEAAAEALREISDFSVIPFLREAILSESSSADLKEAAARTLYTISKWQYFKTFHPMFAAIVTVIVGILGFGVAYLFAKLTKAIFLLAWRLILPTSFLERRFSVSKDDLPFLRMLLHKLGKKNTREVVFGDVPLAPLLARVRDITELGKDFRVSFSPAIKEESYSKTLYYPEDSNSQFSGMSYGSTDVHVDPVPARVEIIELGDEKPRVNGRRLEGEVSKESRSEVRGDEIPVFEFPPESLAALRNITDLAHRELQALPDSDVATTHDADVLLSQLSVFEKKFSTGMTRVESDQLSELLSAAAVFLKKPWPWFRWYSESIKAPRPPSAAQSGAKGDSPLEGSPPRSEARTYVTPVIPQIHAADTSSLVAKIGTAVRVAANTVSPLLSVSPVYASEIAPEIFAGTVHYQKTQVVPPVFSVKWPAFNAILAQSATASTERMVIDQRQGVPDAASVLPLVTFALYNPKAAVVLVLIADASEVAAFEKELAVLSQKSALPQNFAVRAFANENEFVGAFAGFYNSAAPLGQSVALITDRKDSVVTQKIGSRRHLLSVVGAQNPLKQTASTLLAADKLLNDSIWSMGYHFVSVEKLGGLEALMAELTSYVAAQAKVLASA